jgi:hypothetical protein
VDRRQRQMCIRDSPKTPSVGLFKIEYKFD